MSESASMFVQRLFCCCHFCFLGAKAAYKTKSVYSSGIDHQSSEVVKLKHRVAF